MIDPAQKLGIIVLTNANDSPQDRFAGGIMKILSGPIEKAAVPTETPPGAEGDLARFDGLFRDRCGLYVRVVALSGKLRIIDLETDDVETATTNLIQVGPTTFRTQVGDTAYGSNVESLTEFTTDASGRAMEFTIDDGIYRYRRVE
jgi:hypothetical protein